jgi:hypothetical protein
MIASFSVSQTIGLPNIISLADTSTNTFDPAITVREVVMVDAYGNYITASGSSVTPASTTWLVSDMSISIDCLKVDMALQITVNWLSITGAVLYTQTALYDFTQYGVLASFALTQDLTGKPNTLQDQNYWMNRMILRCNIDDADNAVSIGGNIYIAQSSLDREQEMISRQNLYF